MNDNRIFPSLMSRTRRYGFFTPMRNGEIPIRERERIILRNGEYRIPRLRTQIFEINEGKDIMSIIWERYNKLRNEMFKKAEYRVNKFGERVRPIVEKNLPIRITGRLTKWIEKPR